MGAVLVLGGLLGIYALLLRPAGGYGGRSRGRRSSGRRRGLRLVDRAIDEIGNGSTGVLLTALASWSVWALIDLSPTLSVWLGAQFVAALMFVVAPSPAKVAFGALGTVAAVMQLFDDSCVVTDRPGRSLALLALAFFGLAMVGLATRHLARAAVGRSHLGDLALVVFAGVDLVLFAFRPAGYDLVSGQLGPAMWLAILAFTAIIAAGFGAMPRFTTSALGVGLAVAQLAFDIQGDSACNDQLPGTGTVWVLAFTTLVALLRSFGRRL